MEFEGRVALVTGAASGIGRAGVGELGGGGADWSVGEVGGEVALRRPENFLREGGGRVVSFAPM